MALGAEYPKDGIPPVWLDRDGVYAPLEGVVVKPG